MDVLVPAVKHTSFCYNKTIISQPAETELLFLPTRITKDEICNLRGGGVSGGLLCDSHSPQRVVSVNLQVSEGDR